MYESHSGALLSRRLFAKRITVHLLVGGGVLVGALGIGIAGFMFFAHFSLIDAFLDASMLLGGMGPVGELRNDGAKIFAGLYALFAGLIFIGVSGVLVAPFAHRLLHKLHLEKKTAKSSK